MNAKIMERLAAQPSLPEYVRGRRFRLLGPKVLTRHWQKQLSTILSGSSFQLGVQEIVHSDGTSISRMRSDSESDLLQAPLQDILLLGVDSGDVDGDERRFARAIVTRLAALYGESATAAVRQPLPQLIIFPTTDRRLHRHVLAGHVPESFHFVKVIDEDPLTSDIPASLEQSIVAALEDRVCHSIGLPFPEGLMRLRKWLDNFLPEDRPAALAVAERLRFYSMEAMVRLLDSYLQTTSAVSQRKLSILGGEKSSPGTYLFSNLGRPFKSASAVLPLVGRSKWISSFDEDVRLSTLPPKDRRPAVRVYEDLAERIFAQTAGHPDGEILNVVLVDDIVGSGGQLTRYLSKFLGKELCETICRCISEDNAEAVWEHTLRRLSGGWSNVRLHTLFLIGIENEEFESLFELPLRALETGDESCRSVHGVMKIEVPVSTGTISVPVSVHVADYTKPLSALYRENLLDRDATERLLTRREYRGIVQPRGKEHALQFEPFGWKDVGGMVATYANCPGNTLPIVWADGGPGGWFPLFKRFFSPWDDGARAAEEVLKLADEVLCKAATSLSMQEATRLKAYLLHARSRWDKGEIARHLSLELAQVEDAVRVFQRQVDDEPETLELLRKVMRATCQ